MLATSVAAMDTELQAVPDLTQRVNDLTGTLNQEQQQTLESELITLEQRTGAQIAILLVRTTQPEDIAQYAIRVFDIWKLGREHVNDGVLMIIAKDDRRVRIEVAYGLEGAIPDVTAARIINEYITPHFRVDDYYGGIQDALAALMSIIDGEDLPAAWSNSENSSPPSISNALIGSIVISVWLRILLAVLPQLLRAGIMGLILYLFASIVSAQWVIGILAGIFGVLLGSLGGASGRYSMRSGWGSTGSFSVGGFSSSGSSFSGGGGISGGGGASGSW